MPIPLELAMHSPCDSDKLRTDEQASDYYDERYKGEYMQDWPEQKRRRVAELVRALGLRETGTAVDFGCGVGVFSRVLADALPGWRIVGLEISPNAVAAARQLHPAIDFRLMHETDLASIGASFIFSHHVLEHVIDLDIAFQQMARSCHAGARALHVLPCGDPNSFEHRLCMRQRGIDPQAGDRFFYEDPGHVCRLTWQKLGATAQRHGFVADSVVYANAFWGGLAWISKIAPDKAMRMARPQSATTTADRITLTLWRLVLGTLATMNRWAAVQDWRRQHATGLRGRAARLLCWPMGTLGQAVCMAVDVLAEREWRLDRTRTGSEMYALLRLDTINLSTNPLPIDTQPAAGPDNHLHAA